MSEADRTKSLRSEDLDASSGEGDERELVLVINPGESFTIDLPTITPPETLEKIRALFLSKIKPKE